jgi:glutaredoxin
MVTLYTTHCPKCIILEKKLQDKNIEYQICDDIDLMLSKGMQEAPYLEVEEKGLMNFTKAIKWVNEK